MNNALEILVVDNNSDILEVITCHLMDMGFTKVTQATSSKNAQDCLNQKNFDLIILDWMLEDGDCFDVLNYINHLDSDKFSISKNAIKIVITGKDHPNDIARLKSHNINNYFIKPFTSSYFKENLTKVLAKTKG
ncbi:MAG: response regulator [Bdellovibrionales bacterium]|nr:response regulator [Bdellovibrionales bacterium]